MQRNDDNKIYLNVASSIYVLPGFVNLDNHIFLKFKPLMPGLKMFLSKGHNELAKEYASAASKAVLLQHDCRKKLKYNDSTIDHILCSHFLEHVYLEEAQFILRDFYRVLKPGGTLHIIVPDLNKFINDYIENSSKGKGEAADDFIQHTLLSKPTRGTFRYRLMELQGGFGLQHRWMYDSASMEKHVLETGFQIDNTMDVPSGEFRKNDDSVHVRAKKPA